MANGITCDLAVEECGPDGPTGRLLRVLDARVEDYGGNSLGTGKTAAEIRVIVHGGADKLRGIPNRVVAVRTEVTEQPIVHAEIFCAY